MARLPHHLTDRSRRGAFTLIELLVVSAIIAIVAAIAIAGISSMRQAANRETTIGLLKTMAAMAEAYQRETGHIVAHSDYFNPGGGAVRTPEEDPYRIASGGGARLQEYDWTNARYNVDGYTGAAALNIPTGSRTDLQEMSIERFLYATYQRGNGNLAQKPVPAVADLLGNVDGETIVDLDDTTLEPPGNGFLEVRDAWGWKIVYVPYVAYVTAPAAHPEQRDDYTADDFLPRHDRPFFASPGRDGLWGDAQFENVDDDGDGTFDHVDNIYSFEED